MRTLLVLAGFLFAAGSPGADFMAEEAAAANEAKSKPGAVSPDQQESMEAWGPQIQKFKELDETVKNKALPAKQRIDAAAEIGNLTKWAEQRVEKRPDSWIDQMAGSDFFLQAGNYEKAAACADRAVEMGSPEGDPRLTARVLVVRGTANFQKGNIQAAYQDALAAVEMDPTFTPGIELLKYTEGRGDRRPGGVEASSAGDPGARLVAALSPTVPHSVNEYIDRHNEVPTLASEAAIKALKQRSMGNFAAARTLADQALASDPGDPMAHAVKGFALNDAGDHNGAIIETTQAMAKGWHDPTLFAVRAQALEKAGQLKAALEDADMAARLEPNNANHYITRGMIQMKLDIAEGRVDGRFLADLEKAAKLDPAKWGQVFENNKRQFQDYQAKTQARSGGAAGQQPSENQAAPSKSWTPTELAEWNENQKTATGKVKNGIKVVKKTAATSPELVALGGGVSILIVGATVFFLNRSNDSPPPKHNEVEMIFESSRRREDQVVIRPIRKPGEPPIT